jgi:hypothetical protein
VRGDDRNPDKEHPLAPGVPEGLGGPAGGLQVEPVALPLTAAVPEKAEHVVRETIAASAESIAAARGAFQAAAVAASGAEKAADPLAERDLAVAEMGIALAEARHAALLAALRVEGLEDAGGRERDPDGWAKAATEAMTTARWSRFLERRREGAALALALGRAEAAASAAEAALAGAEGDKAKADAAGKAAAALAKAKEALAKAQKEHAEAGAALLQPASTDYPRRDLKTYPPSSTGRRLAFARWIAHRSTAGRRPTLTSSTGSPSSSWSHRHRRRASPGR